MTTRSTLAQKLRCLMTAVSIVLLLPAASGVAGGAYPDSTAAPAGNVPWEFSVGGYLYTLPFDDDILIAVAIAQHGSLHLEARYNYEDLKTGSAFVGWTFSMGETFTAALTPMAGVAFGRTTGIVPALEAELGYGIADFYLESEYLIDLDEREWSFFYTWLELGVSPGDLFRVGLSAQRTRLFQTPLELDRGLFVELTPDVGAVSLYAFNVFTDNWFMVISARVDW